MPITYQIDRELGLIRTRCVGDVPFREVAAHFQQLARDSSLPFPLDVLLDLTALESVPESDKLRAAAREVELAQKAVTWGSCAIVARGDLLFGIGRVFQAFSQQHFVHSNVFRAQDEAERWLASLRSLRP